ncbi:hypothetical protein [Sphingobacterium griseoflavum]|uniref:YokE-like PH domain-containing protein n=1 Tax=Sphingobacterium griseoflavum TaxID=1474952 RepID=A0ABQ3HTZ4_9SPHI|nr:hypothetical protein [Sphingobacterium griseoflavum]GHE31307.1 hypothetical protein GCM10017764_13020 [Sphingobacterium griseoflavum]
MKKELEMLLQANNKLVYNALCGVERLQNNRMLYYYVGKRSVDYFGENITDDTLINVFFDTAELDEQGRLIITSAPTGFLPIKYKYLKNADASLKLEQVKTFYKESVN